MNLCLNQISYSQLVSFLIFLILCLLLFQLLSCSISLDNSFSSVVKKLNKSYNYKIIIFRSVSYANLPKYFKYHNNILEDYCNLHGYELKIFKHKDNVCPYWLRVMDLIRLSEIYDSNTIFIYMDIDTIINPSYLDKDINQLLCAYDTKSNINWDMYMGSDLDHIVNTGVMIVKNTSWSKQLLNLWYGQYKSKNWIYDSITNEWIYHHNGIKSQFATHGYEQGELNKLMMFGAIDYKNNIAVMHYSWLSNRDINDPCDTFIYHFYSNNDDQFKLDSMRLIYDNI